MAQVKMMTREEFEMRIRDVEREGLHVEVNVSSNEQPYGPEFDDLYYLYGIVRETAAVSVMEFGSGWSTLAFSLGLDENRRSMAQSYSTRHPNPFRLLTIDASSEWLEVSLARLPTSVRDLVVGHTATPILSLQNGQFVTFFDYLPFFVPDIVYLDGPDPEQVTGEIDGFTSPEIHALPMCADMLRVEPHLWPGTLIITDGRRANARMLETNFRRSWQVLHDPFGDHTIFRLDESPFGPVSESHISARLEAARNLRKKENPVSG